MDSPINIAASLCPSEDLWSPGGFYAKVRVCAQPQCVFIKVE